MPEEPRKPFRPVGMRMQRFSQSLMRSYLPPAEEMPAPAAMPPVWQNATQVPLTWENQTVQAPAPTLPPVETNEPRSMSPELQALLPQQAAPTPAAQRSTVPPPAPAPAAQPAPIQRAAAPPAPSREQKMSQNLLNILAAHQAQDAARGVIREEKKTLFSAAAEPARTDDKEPIRRTRSRASFDYIETTPLLKGEDAPAAKQSSEPAAQSTDESAADDDGDDSAPVAQAAGPPEASFEPSTAQGDAAPTIQPTRDEGLTAPAQPVIQRTEAPEAAAAPIESPALETPETTASAASFDADTPSFPATEAASPPIKPTWDAGTATPAQPVVQRTESPEASAPIEPPALETPETTASTAPFDADTPSLPATEAASPTIQPMRDAGTATPAQPVVQRTESPEASAPIEPPARETPEMPASAAPFDADTPTFSPAGTTTPAQPVLQRSETPEAAAAPIEPPALETPENTTSAASFDVDTPTFSPAGTTTPDQPVLQRTEAPESAAPNEPPARETPDTAFDDQIVPDAFTSPAPSQAAPHAVVQRTAADTPTEQVTSEPVRIPDDVDAQPIAAVDDEVNTPTVATIQPVTDQPQSPPSIGDIVQTSREAVPASDSTPETINDSAEWVDDTLSAPISADIVQNVTPSTAPDAAAVQRFVDTDVPESVQPQAPSPSQSIQRASDEAGASVQPERGTWHRPNSVQPEDTEISQSAPASSDLPDSEPVKGMWHSPDSSYQPPIPVADTAPLSQSEQPVAPPSDPIQRQADVTHESAAAVIQRAEAPPASLPEAPSTPHQEQAVDHIQREVEAVAPVGQPAVPHSPAVPASETAQPTAADIIQRAEATHPAPTPESAPASEPAHDLHEVDLFEALNATGEPAAPASDVVQPKADISPTAAEVIQRAEARPSPTQENAPASEPAGNLQPIDLFEALNAANQPAASDHQSSEPEAAPQIIQRTVDDSEVPTKPDRKAVDEALLSLLQSVSPPRSTASASEPSTAPAPVQRQTMPPTIQREFSETGEEVEMNEDTGVDVDRLARDVYKMLQNRLRIERERRDRF